MPNKTDRSERIAIRVAPALKAVLSASAEAEGRTTSDYVRRLIIENIVELCPAPPTQEMPHG